MSQRVPRQLIAEHATVRDDPVMRSPTVVDRNFELPTALYAAMAVLFFAAAGVLAFGFYAPGMVIPSGIIAIFIAMFFAVPARWVRMKPSTSGSAMSWSRFRNEGIVTPYGRSTAGDATMQVLILPAVILVWATVTVTIAAFVR